MLKAYTTTLSFAARLSRWEQVTNYARKLSKKFNLFIMELNANTT